MPFDDLITTSPKNISWCISRGMAGSFAFALYLTFTSALIDFNVARLQQEAEEGFAMLLGETMVYARRSYTMCLAMFMMAFTVRTTGAENWGQKSEVT